MLVSDENLPASQRRLLRKWRIHFRAVVVDLAAPEAAAFSSAPPSRFPTRVLLLVPAEKITANRRHAEILPTWPREMPQ